MRRDIVTNEISPYVFDGSGPSTEKLIFEAKARQQLAVPARLAYGVGFLLAAVGNRTLSRDKMMYIDSERLGPGGQMIDTYKWKTLKDGSQHSGRGVDKGKSAVPLGNLHRRLSTDESPQLFQLGVVDIVGPFRPEKREDRERQLAYMREADLTKEADILEAGFELVNPSVASLAATYGHWSFDCDNEEVVRSSDIVRGILSVDYLREADARLDTAIEKGIIPDLGRAALAPKRCGAFEMKNTHGLVGSYVARIAHIYPHFAQAIPQGVQDQYDAPAVYAAV